MEQVEAYRASGMKAKVWAEANGVPLGTLGSWCAHYRRWQAKRNAGPGGASVEHPTTRLWAPVRSCLKSADLKILVV